MKPPTDREREARATLERVRRDTESIGSSSAARATARLKDHFSGADAIGAAEDGGTDRIELWGRRIGRAISAVLALVLAWYLGVQLHYW